VGRGGGRERWLSAKLLTSKYSLLFCQDQYHVRITIPNVVTGQQGVNARKMSSGCPSTAK